MNESIYICAGEIQTAAKLKHRWTNSVGRASCTSICIDTQSPTHGVSQASISAILRKACRAHISTRRLIRTESRRESIMQMGLHSSALFQRAYKGFRSYISPPLSLSLCFFVLPVAESAEKVRAHESASRNFLPAAVGYYMRAARVCSMAELCSLSFSLLLRPPRFHFYSESRSLERASACAGRSCSNIGCSDQ